MGEAGAQRDGLGFVLLKGQVKVYVLALFLMIFLSALASAESGDSFALSELRTAQRLFERLKTKIEVSGGASAEDAMRLETLRTNIAARMASLGIEAPAPEQLAQTRAIEPLSRLTAWSSVLQRQVPVRKGTRLVVGGEMATVVEALTPYRVSYLRTSGAEGLLAGRPEYPSVYATVEIPGFDAESIFRADLIRSRAGILLGTVEAVFDDGSIFIQRLNGQVEKLGRVGDLQIRSLQFTRTRATSCRMSF